jgi:hypothetical protein
MLGALFVAALTAVQPSLHPDLVALGKLVETERWADAARLAREVEARIAKQAPLEVIDGRALAAPADGLGIYHELPDGLVRGDELYLYAQVRGHALRKIEAWHELHLVSDLIVLDAKGRELARDMAFGESRFRARAVHRDTFVNIALRVRGLPAGKYRVVLVVHDVIGHKEGSVEIPFVMP